MEIPDYIFFSLLFIFLVSLSLSLFRWALRRNEASKRARVGRRGEGVRKIWLGCCVDPTSPFIFLSTSRRGGIADRVECRPLQMRFVETETGTVARSSIRRFLLSLATFGKKSLASIRQGKKNERTKCEREKEGEGKESAETKVASPRLTSLFKCLYCRWENSFFFLVRSGIRNRSTGKNPLEFPRRYRYQEEAAGFFNGFKCSSILAANKQER